MTEINSEVRHVAGTAITSTLKRFTTFVERIAENEQARLDMTGRFISPLTAEAYAAYVLHAPGADMDRELTREFDFHHVGSYNTWQEAQEALLAEPKMLDPISDATLAELQDLPILELRPWVDQLIRRRLEDRYTIVHTDTGTVHVFTPCD